MRVDLKRQPCYALCKPHLLKLEDTITKGAPHLRIE
uniref:Uncharacterized protein n=1 Tax=Klebsiella phage vB_KpnM_Iguana_ER37 TaxID=3076781 RepID=A0AB38Z3K9_9CAUD